MKRIRFLFVLVVIVTVCLANVLTASAEERLEIVQASQTGNQLVLYTLLTDAETGEVVTSSLNPQQVRAVAGQFGDAKTSSVQSFSQTKEGVAYAVVVDMNSFMLNAVKLSTLQDALGTFLNTLRDADRMMLLSIGKSGAKTITGGFEKDRLKINNLIKALSTEDKAKETALYQGVERAIGAFSSTDTDFPVRRAVVVFTYGADNGSMAAEVLAEKASKSGVPVYFITLKGKDAEGNLKTIDTADLDRIARGSHGRVLDGKTDLEAAVTRLSQYISGASVITVEPSQAAWDALSAQWSVSVQVDDRTVTNDGDGNYAVLLSPTPTPAPSASRSVTLTWANDESQSDKRPASVTAHLLLNGAEVGKALTLNAENSWKGVWNGLADNAEYTAMVDSIDGYQLSVAPADAQGAFHVTASLTASPAAATPEATAVPLRDLSVSLSWDDQDNADNLRPASVEASVLANSVDMGDPKTLNAANNWSADWPKLPDNGASYTVALDAAEGYTLSAPVADGTALSFTASHTPATLIQKLFSPPLLYVALGVIVLLLVLLALLFMSAKHKPVKVEDVPGLDEEPEGMPRAPSVMDLANDERTRPMQGEGEETLGLFADDAERTLGMEDQRLRIDAEIEYLGQKKQQTLLLLSSLTIGRGQDCGLVLEDPRVSRKHCKITLKPDGLYIADLGSRSGTFLNDVQAVTEKAIKTGDVLTLGMTRVTLNIRK